MQGRSRLLTWAGPMMRDRCCAVAYGPRHPATMQFTAPANSISLLPMTTFAARQFALLLAGTVLCGASATGQSQNTNAAGVAQTGTAPQTQAIKVAGLKQSVQILIDRWGVPHIYAQSQDDVFFAQGFNAARDRLFQIDLWHRRGRGRLSSVFGPNFVEQDRAARLFLYRGDMQKEWLAYGRNADQITGRFVAGHKSSFSSSQSHPARTPLSGFLLRSPTARWGGADGRR